MKKYLLELKDGQTREITILDKPVYKCKMEGEGNDVYRTMNEIISKQYKLVDEEPYYLWQDYVGTLKDEGVMFQVYKSLRNPIVKLTIE